MSDERDDNLIDVVEHLPEVAIWRRLYLEQMESTRRHAELDLQARAEQSAATRALGEVFAARIDSMRDAVVEASHEQGRELRSIMTQQASRDTRLILAFAVGVLVLSGAAFWLQIGDVGGGTMPPALAPREIP